LDSLHQISVEACTHSELLTLPKIINAYIDSIQVYTDRDSLIMKLLKGTLNGCSFQSNDSDTLFRQQVKVQLDLLQYIGFNYLASKISICGDLRFDENQPILVPHLLEAKVGQPFEAHIFLTNRTPCNYEVDLTVNEQRYPSIYGMSNFQTTFQKSGINELRLKVVTKNLLTGEVHTSMRIVEVLVKA
jgi:hypothetical protein